MSGRPDAPEPLRTAKAAPGSNDPDPGRSDMSHVLHDIRQPLSAIRTNAEVALRWLAENDPARAGEAIDRILHIERRVNALVASLGERALVSRDRWARLDMTGLVGGLVSLLEHDLRLDRMTIEVKLAEGPVWVLGDYLLLERAITNLLVNGVEAMRLAPGREHRLRIAARARVPDMLIEIGDTGVGLDPSIRHRVFDAAFTTKAGGTGLGLTSALAVTKAHGGRLWASANRPHGSIFRLSLPLSD
jgi:signal transduction histidine kinase